MKKVRITVKKIAHYDDLIEQYENPLEHACSMELGQTFICNGWEKPEGFCSSAWDTVSIPIFYSDMHGISKDGCDRTVSTLPCICQLLIVHIVRILNRHQSSPYSHPVE